jgi:hypothetical protein
MSVMTVAGKGPITSQGIFLIKFSNGFLFLEFRYQELHGFPCVRRVIPNYIEVTKAGW